LFRHGHVVIIIIISPLALSLSFDSFIPPRSVQTSYAAVEPKRRRQQPLPQSQHTPGSFAGRQQQQQQHQQQGRELKRARIVITVKRTEQYKRWLEENPYQAVLVGDGAVEEEEATTDAPSTSYVR
jgi:hypothetical protein